MNTPISALLEQKGSHVHTVSSTVTVSEAVDEMNRHHVGCVVVVDADRLAGIFTERDVLVRVVGAGLDPRKTRMADIMTRDVATIPPAASTSEAMALFSAKKCRHLPVVEGGNLRGLISIGDISRWTDEVHRAEAEQLKSYISGGNA